LADESWQMLASFSLARFHELDSAAARHAATMAGQLKLRGPDAVHAATAFATNSILITMDRERAAPLVTTMTPEKWLSECEP
jgi:predicted nucleic acid-binding protein